jgi:hypothetical protein
MKKTLLLLKIIAIGIVMLCNNNILFGATPNITLTIDRIDMNSVSLVWDTLPTALNVTGYKIVYSGNNEPFSTTVTANIKDVNFWEMKTNSNNVYYTLRPIDYGSIYNIFVVPVMSNSVSWTAQSNMLTFTTRSDYWAYNMLAGDDMAIKELTGVSITPGTFSSGNMMMSITPTANHDWYIKEIIFTSSITGGVASVSVDNVMKDVIPVNVPMVYDIPIKVGDGKNLSVNLIYGNAVYYVRIKYYDFNKYGK